MKIALKILFVMVLLTCFTGCLNNKQNVDELMKENNDMDIITSINVIIDNKSYVAKLEENETSQSFARMIPQEFDMKELNGNEKYIYMDKSLPTNPKAQKHILAGDIMLYGDDCLVIFYKTFDTSYSYTKIGHIDELPNLGNGSVTVKFEK